MTQPLAFFVFQKHSVFMPLKYVYGECFTLIEKYDKVAPLHCLKADICPANVGCMDILAKRINYLFTYVVPEAQLLVAYFKYRDKPDSIRAGVFDRNLSEPKVMTLNQSAFKKFQRESLTFTWVPTMEYLTLSRSTTLIPVQSLLLKPHE